MAPSLDLSHFAKGAALQRNRSLEKVKPKSTLVENRTPCGAVGQVAGERYRNDFSRMPP